MKDNIKNMPKVILHIHLDGSLRVKTICELSDNKNYDLMKKELSVNEECNSLEEYLKKFELPIKVLQTKDNIRRCVFELFEDLYYENVIYAEVRFAPMFHTLKGLSFDEIVESAIMGMNDARNKCGIEGNLILCCMRGENNKIDNLKTLEVAKKYYGKGVCGIDLAGNEAIYKLKDYDYIFKKAKEYGILYTIHAGEAAGPISIKEALSLGCKRIGHGIRCIEDNELLNCLKEKQIALEICPISNMQTKAVIGKYPLEALYKMGIVTTINTDNNTVSNTNIINEYQWVLNNTNLNYDDLLNMNINATKNIFGSNEVKEKILKNFEIFKSKM